MARKKNRAKPANQARAIVFHSHFIEDLRYWVKTNRSIAVRALEIVQDVQRDPFSGLGKPEPLKHLLQGAWSRRLTEEHRIVYRVTEDALIFLQARYHYGKR